MNDNIGIRGGTSISIT